MISGLKFPVQINTMGRFAIVEDDDKIKQNARAIINTRIKERYYAPTMGRSDAVSYTHLTLPTTPYV